MKKKVFAAAAFVILASLSFTVFVQNTVLVDVHAFVNQALLRVSGEEQVIVGRSGWLFFADTLPAYFGRNIDEGRIAETVDALAALGDALAMRNVSLILLIAPDKNSIYPEFMPLNMIQGESDSAARLLMNRLDGARVNVIDAFALLESRKAEGVYHKTDTHWNALGALYVYREIMDALDVPHDDYADAEWETRSRTGDLTKLYHPNIRAAEETSEPIIERRYSASRPVVNLDAADIRTTSGTNALRLLVLRDSFGEALFPFLANNAGNLTYLRAAPSDGGFILSHDAIIIEIVERNLYDAVQFCNIMLNAISDKMQE